nr:reverse transcriptase domain-containing protein [Tanacetum cinerariifolium]
MRTRYSSNLVGESSPNPTTSNPKRRNRRHSKQPFILEESPLDTMADQRTMEELLRAPTEGYAKAIVQTSAVTTAMIAILKQFQATPPPAFVKAIEEIYVTCGGANPYYQNEMQTSIQASMSKQTHELKDIMARFFQMNTASTSGSGPLPSNTIANPKGELKSITTRSGLVLDGPSVPMPLPFINPKEDKRVEETLTDPELAEYTIKVPPPLVYKAKPLSLRNYVMLKALLSNKEKLLELTNTPLNENCLAVILKKLPEKLGDPGKFLIPCDFSELKCKALADLGVSINLMPLLVWKKLGLPELISTRMTLELANRAICTPAGITRDVFVPVGKFTFPADFVIIDYESNPRFLPHLGKTFLTDRSDLTSPEVINPLSGNATSSSPDHLLKEFAIELALITFPQGNDDLLFDIKSDLREIEYLLNHDPTKEMESILED